MSTRGTAFSPSLYTTHRSYGETLEQHWAVVSYLQGCLFHQSRPFFKAFYLHVLTTTI